MKKLNWLIFLLFFPLGLFAQGVQHINFAWALSGTNAVVLLPAATVTVCAGSTLPSPGVTCSPTTTIYTSVTLGSAATNPITADSGGNYSFWGMPGSSYVISVSFVGYVTYSYAWVGGVSNPVAANSIQYVSPQGNDTYTGLSWAASKFTVTGALQALPGGSTGVAGSGTIYVASGSQLNAAGVTYGLWIMGAADPNYGSPPTGWLKSGGTQNTYIIGVTATAGGPNPPRPQASVIGGVDTDNNHPGLWIAATSGYPLEFDNLAFTSSNGAHGRGIIIGECSNHNRTGTCNTTLVTFENDSAFVGNSVTTGGPCTDIAGWNYWIWFRDFGCSGNAGANASGYTSNSAASILLDGSLGNGNGLIYFSDTHLANGGIKIIPGSSGGYVSLINTFEEGCCGNTPPPIWWTAWPAGTQGYVQNVSYADISNAPPTVENDATSTQYGAPIVINPGAAIQGPAIVLQPFPTGGTISPLRQQQYGVNGNYLTGETDVARRLSTLTPVRYANLAYSNPSSWTATVGSVTITTGVADPFGGTGAATLTSTAGGTVNLSPTNSEPGTAGDWFVYGAWIQGGGWAPNAQTYLQNVCPTHGGFFYSATYENGGQEAGDGQWQYVWIAGKISTTGTATACISAVVQAATPVTIYGPWINYISTGTLSDNEVLEYVSTTNSVDRACQVGTICNVTGHPLAVDVVNETGGNNFGSVVKYSAAACETNFGATTLSGASTTTGQTCLPANAVIDAVVYRITTTITTATSFTIGDSGSATRYCGTQSTLTSGTTGTCTAAGYYLNASALGVKITPSTTPGAGAIRLIVYYHTWVAPTS